MCTLSWLPADEGYTLCFNRDERPNRPALPPERRAHAGLAFIAPSDAVAGGTWIAVNASGMSVALLNRYLPALGPPPERPVSRGLLVLSLIGASETRSLRQRLESMPLRSYHPFTLAATEPGAPVSGFEWDGMSLQQTTYSTPGLILTSSGFDQALADATRREVAAALFAREGLSPDALAALHRSHEPARGPLSVCMHREEAVTRSYSRIDVSAGTISFTHVDGAPCTGQPMAPVRLGRARDRA